VITPGQSAYETFRASVQVVAEGNAVQMLEVAHYLDKVVPPWDKILPEMVLLWESIAAMAIETHRGLNACSCRRPPIDPSLRKG
jgi:hypothetical protein